MPNTWRLRHITKTCKKISNTLGKHNPYLYNTNVNKLNQKQMQVKIEESLGGRYLTLSISDNGTCWSGISVANVSELGEIAKAIQFYIDKKKAV